MSISCPVSDTQVLAHIKEILQIYAPEISATEIVPSAHLTQDLQLDLTTHWVLAINLEKVTNTELLDADIQQAKTIADLMNLVLAQLGTNNQHAISPADKNKNTASFAVNSAEINAVNSTSDTNKTALNPASESDLAGAVADLANLFNN